MLVLLDVPALTVPLTVTEVDPRLEVVGLTDQLGVDVAASAGAINTSVWANTAIIAKSATRMLRVPQVRREPVDFTLNGRGISLIA